DDGEVGQRPVAEGSLRTLGRVVDGLAGREADRERGQKKIVKLPGAIVARDRRTLPVFLADDGRQRLERGGEKVAKRPIAIVARDARTIRVHLSARREREKIEIEGCGPSEGRRARELRSLVDCLADRRDRVDGRSERRSRPCEGARALRSRAVEGLLTGRRRGGCD